MQQSWLYTQIGPFEEQFGTIRPSPSGDRRSPRRVAGAPIAPVPDNHIQASAPRRNTPW